MRGQVFIVSPKIRYFSTTEIAMFAERALLGGDPRALSARQVCCKHSPEMGKDTRQYWVLVLDPALRRWAGT